MIERAGFFPQLDDEDVVYETISFEKNNLTLHVEVPVLTDNQLLKIVEKVKWASDNVLKSLSVSDIVTIIDEVVERLLDRDNVYRKKMEQLLPIVTGYDAEMIRLGLTSYFKTFRKQQLLQFLVEDFGNPLILDDFQPRAKGGYSKAIGPRMMTHIWAGNVPALPLWSIVSSLLVKGASIGKVSSSEPLFAGWVAALLTEVEPRLANCLAIIWWKGGDEDKEGHLFEVSDVVLAYGGNESLTSLKARVPVTTRFLPYGHKMGFGLVSKESLNARNALETARRAAFDVMHYDQQGCYSPHFFFVQSGGKVSPKVFSEYVANELTAFETRYPRRFLLIEEEAALVKWKQNEEISLFTDQSKEVLSPVSGRWTVVYELLKEHVTPSPLNRNVRIIEVSDFDAIVPLLIPYRKYLQTAGIASAPKELFRLSGLLADIGVTRITSIGQMTAPEAGWHHDGTCNLLDLVRIIDIERGAEEHADSYSPYRD
jgi:hypothetical protein